MILLLKNNPVKFLLIFDPVKFFLYTMSCLTVKDGSAFVLEKEKTF